MIHVISTLSFYTKTLIRHFLSLSGICCHGSNFCARINCSLHLLAKKENSRCVMQCANPSPSGTQVIIIIFVSLFVIVFFFLPSFHFSPTLFPMVSYSQEQVQTIIGWDCRILTPCTKYFLPHSRSRLICIINSDFACGSARAVVYLVL